MTTVGSQVYVERRILVVGAPRSGTTLVQSLLAAHGALTSFTESHFFDRHFALLPWSSRAVLVRNPAARLGAFLTENGETAPEAASWFGIGTCRRTPGIGLLMPWRTRPAARHLLLILDQLARRRDRPGWVEKTPRHLRYLPFLERVCPPGPPLRAVHVVRSGPDVVASLREASTHWERPYDLGDCIERWNDDVAFSLARLASSPDVAVLYEDLVARPEATLRDLLAGLGLPWDETMLARYSETSSRLVTAEEERWKENVGRDLRCSRTAERLLSDSERRAVDRDLRSELYQRIRELVAERGHGGQRGA